MALVIVIAAVSLLLRPASLIRLAVLAASVVAFVWVESPGANHIVFDGFLNLTILIVIGRWFLKAKKEGRLDRHGVFAEFSALLRLQLVILYFFAVFHKLNTDYFNPDVSCAVYLLEMIKERFSFIPVTYGTRLFSIWGTLVIEAAIPLLLIQRRTRNYGIILGLVFHFFLSLPQHQGLYSFSAMLFALYFLFLPEEFTARIKRIWSKSGLGRWSISRASVIAALFSLLTISVWMIMNHCFDGKDVTQLEACLRGRGVYLWIPYACVVSAIYLAAIFSGPMEQPKTRQMFRRTLSPALIVPILLFLHSASPYLGLKTTPCLSMFSNLRTEGPRPNHLLIPASFKIAGFEDDLVEVISSSDEDFQKLADGGLLLPYFEFRKEASQKKEPFTVEYIRGGQRIFLKKDGPQDTSVIKPVPWFLGKLLRFRPVTKTGPMKCSQ